MARYMVTRCLAGEGASIGRDIRYDEYSKYVDIGWWGSHISKPILIEL